MQEFFFCEIYVRMCGVKSDVGLSWHILKEGAAHIFVINTSTVILRAIRAEGSRKVVTKKKKKNAEVKISSHERKTWV